MFGWLRLLFGRKPRKTARTLTLAPRGRLRAIYDAAQTTDDNRRHWDNADALSAASANDLETRKNLRERARYESANNSYCRGMILTLANDLVGTGPRLQVLTDKPEVNRKIEQAFAAWSRAIGLAEKLRTMVQSKKVDGEAFAVLTTNELLPTSVKLDVQLVECDRVTDPNWQATLRDDVNDGIEYDEAGNPIAYTVLDDHPGDTLQWERTSKRFSASDVIHWFRADRPGQLRGVPEITPALPLYAQLRRFTQAVLTAAETAADFAVLLESNASGDTETSDDDAFATAEIEKGLMAQLPAGMKASQLKAEQPSSTYDQFHGKILNEIARCLNMPFNVAAGNSASYNYSSGRLDHQVYFKSCSIERSHLDCVGLARILAAWLDEAVMIPELIPAGVDIEGLPVLWHWDGWEHVDPTKEAQAEQIELTNGTRSRTEICAARGVSWEDTVLPMLAKEREQMAEAGLLPAAPAAPAAPANDSQTSDQSSDGADGEDVENEPADEEAAAASR